MNKKYHAISHPSYLGELLHQHYLFVPKDPLQNIEYLKPVKTYKSFKDFQ